MNKVMGIAVCPGLLTLPTAAHALGVAGSTEIKSVEGEIAGDPAAARAGGRARGITALLGINEDPHFQTARSERTALLRATRTQ